MRTLGGTRLKGILLCGCFRDCLSPYTERARPIIVGSLKRPYETADSRKEISPRPAEWLFVLGALLSANIGFYLLYRRGLRSERAVAASMGSE